MISTYVYEANAVIYCYDITNYQSFQDLEDWRELVMKTFQNKELPKEILIGNKVDLNHLQAVKSDQHSKFAQKYKMKSYFCSAKTGD